MSGTGRAAPSDVVAYQGLHESRPGHALHRSRGGQRAAVLDLPHRGLWGSDRRAEETIFILSPVQPESNQEFFVVTQQHIQASHRDMELDAELRQGSQRGHLHGGGHR
jgi:hypothetical protein